MFLTPLFIVRGFPLQPVYLITFPEGSNGPLLCLHKVDCLFVFLPPPPGAFGTLALFACARTSSCSPLLTILSVLVFPSLLPAASHPDCVFSPLEWLLQVSVPCSLSDQPPLSAVSIWLLQVSIPCSSQTSMLPPWFSFSYLLSSLPYWEKSRNHTRGLMVLSHLTTLLGFNSYF